MKAFILQYLSHVISGTYRYIRSSSTITTSICFATNIIRTPEFPPVKPRLQPVNRMSNDIDVYGSLKTMPNTYTQEHSLCFYGYIQQYSYWYKCTCAFIVVNKIPKLTKLYLIKPSIERPIVLHYYRLFSAYNSRIKASRSSAQRNKLQNERPKNRPFACTS